LAAVITALLFGGAVRVADLRLPRRPSEDEQIYTFQAKRMLNDGIVSGNRATAQIYLRNLSLWKYPPATRLGYVIPLATVMKLTGRDNEDAGAYISCVASILALVVTACVGLEFFGEWATVLGVALLSVFVPDLFMANRCWTDAMAGLAGLAMAWLTLKIFTGNRSLAVAALLPAIASVALLTKETSIIIYGPCLLAAAGVFLFCDGSKKRLGVLLGCAALGAVADLAVWTLCTGRVGLFAELILNNLDATTTNPYVVDWQSGPGYLLLSALRILSPLTLNLALLGMLIALLPSSLYRARGIPDPLRRRRMAAALATGTVVFVAIFMFMPHWRNLRFISAAYGPMCLFAGLAIQQTLAIARRRARPIFFWTFASGICAVLLISPISDYQRFGTYLRRGLTDASARLVIAYAGIVDSQQR
jgi:hypothetical protein